MGGFQWVILFGVWIGMTIVIRYCCRDLCLGLVVYLGRHLIHFGSPLSPHLHFHRHQIDLNPLDHLGPDQLPLLPGGVGSFPDLFGLSESVPNAEDSQVEAVDGLAIHECLDEGAPLSDRVQSLVPV